jgi:hypothetical protein
MANSDTAPLSALELARLRRLLDRQDIEDCLARIARATDRFDRDLFLSGFHEGATVSVGGSTLPASETYEGGRAMHAQSTFATLHCLSTMSCEIGSDTAHVETYHIYCARDRDEANWAAAGRYIDRFERRGGIWAIAFRHISVEWTGRLTPNAIALLGDVERKERLGSSRDPDDVSYLRPLHP